MCPHSSLLVNSGKRWQACIFWRIEAMPMWTVIWCNWSGAIDSCSWCWVPNICSLCGLWVLVRLNLVCFLRPNILITRGSKLSKAPIFDSDVCVPMTGWTWNFWLSFLGEECSSSTPKPLWRPKQSMVSGEAQGIHFETSLLLEQKQYYRCSQRFAPETLIVVFLGVQSLILLLFPSSITFACA